ncbi:MAG: ATP-binding protein [Gammaproteobacteria bacterium]|nr:ATP-binding protein [Gammaproteobacteria bacterium]
MASNTQKNDPWGPEYWRALYYFNLYRLMLAVGLSALAVGGAAVVDIGARSPRLFLLASLAMLLVGLINMVTITMGQPRFRRQAHIQFFLDIVLITLLGFASGGVTGGFGLLLIVSVAAGGVVLSGRMTLFFAALATVASLIEYMVSRVVYGYETGSLTQLGLLGLGLFSTGLVLYFVAYRIRSTEALAKSQAVDLAKLAHLNELVVARLDTGVLVLGPDGEIELANDRARAICGGPDTGDTDLTHVSELPAPLRAEFEAWRTAPEREAHPFRLDRGPHLVARFTATGDHADADTAVFLEDISQAEQHAQQLKLAALGRLTAAIAHEIRNPLGAISHAGQLMHESQDLTPPDQRLARIITEQSNRINQIIKGILQLGRPDTVSAVPIQLDTWLVEFRKSFAELSGLSAQVIEIRDLSLQVCTDPDQLHQVLTNLCQNALRHSPEFDGHALITLEPGWIDVNEIGYLDVVDRGSGIPPEHQDKIFEPFFTTAQSKGTGLGLYLSRELCETNHGRLDYIDDGKPGSRFRIQFAPRRLCEQV